MSNSTWSLDSLQVGTYKGVLRATSNSSNMDFYVNLVVTSTIGIEEIVKYQSTSYRVYDWNGKFIGTDLRGLRGLYIVRYNNGKSEKIFIQ